MAVLNQTYSDLCSEIDILVIRISSLEREREQYVRMMFANAPKGAGTVDYSQEKVQNGFAAFPLDELVERIQEIDEALKPLYAIRDGKEHTKKEMEERMSKFEGLDYKVAYMRMQGLSLIEIADDLGYSYDWIKKISSGLKRRHF